MPMYVVVCRHVHWQSLPGKKCGSLCQCAGIPFLGLMVQGPRFKVCPPCTCTLGNWCHMHMHTWAPLPCAHAHLGENSLPPYFQLLPLCSSKKGIAAGIWQSIGKLFPHICLAYALSNTWPRQARDKCRMDVLNAHHCLQPMPLGINCPLFQNILHTVPRMQQSLLVHGHWP